jgi:type II secretory pathway pseudopilin PulG
MKIENLKLKIRKQGGFTAVETLTTVFVFSIVAVVFGGAFVDALNIQRRAFNIQQVEENISFVLEAMAKEIRVSEIPVASTSCPLTPGNSLTIIHPVNGTITYSLTNNVVHRLVDSGSGGPIDTTISSGTVQFNRLQFCISGANFADQLQPRVTILAGVRSTNTIQQATMDMQTTISTRYLSD